MNTITNPEVIIKLSVIPFLALSGTATNNYLESSIDQKSTFAEMCKYTADLQFNLFDGNHAFNGMSTNTAVRTINEDDYYQSLTQEWTIANFEGQTSSDLMFSNFEFEFKKEVQSRGSYINGSIEEATYEFTQIAKKLSTIEIEDYSVELVPNNSVNFTLLLSNNRTLRISKSFDKLNNLEDQPIIYTLFQDGDLIEADADTIDNFVQNVKEYLSAEV